MAKKKSEEQALDGEVLDAPIENIAEEEINADAEELYGLEPILEQKSDAEAPIAESSISEIPVTEVAVNPQTPVLQKSAPLTGSSVITLEVGDEVETSGDMDEKNWFHLQNAYRTKKILTGTLGGLETLNSGVHTAVVNFRGYRIVIPGSEMGITTYDSEYLTSNQRLEMIISYMLGSEIDFIIKGIDNKTKSIVASRLDALAKKRRLFYYPIEGALRPLIEPGSVVQARVVAVLNNAIRIEVFGAETTVYNQNLSWSWISDAKEHFTIGQVVLARVNEIHFSENDVEYIRADLRSTEEDNSLEILRGCKIQGKYAGTITHIYNGSIYLRLSNGVNAVAHSYHDKNMPTKKDDVIFIITHINEDRRLAVGLISKIVKRNF